MDATEAGYEYYSSHCTFDGDGKISNAADELLWNLKTLERPWPFRYGVLCDPGCSFSNSRDDDHLLVTRKRRFPLARFVVTRKEEPVCTITQLNLFRNKYSLDFAQGTTWTFHMPLFAVFFQGTSETGRIVQVREWSKRQWFIRVQEEVAEPLLLCALSIIHRERLRSG